MSGDFLSCQGITLKRSSRSVVLNDVSLTFRRGELIGLLGLNGAGKSTLLRILMGLLKPTSGEVYLEGTLLSSLRPLDVARRLAYVPQAHAMTFPYTVRRMVELGRIPHHGVAGRLGAEDRLRVDQAMGRLGLLALAERPVTELSGGEKQRVVLARALAQEAVGLLLDEPMSGLDYGHQLRLMSLLAELAAEGHLILLASHRPEEFFSAGHRALILEEAQIVADGPPELIVTAERMSRLYGVPLAQIDHAGKRFFHREESE
ncbi:MAG: ABC transporter ATP-binding protein [Gluconobacter sp.]|uniref:ABC transporter ATP-binding protein n=1 Tax=Gluconobacter sp. TaxID=1876758 RepID=UPI0039EA9994